MTPFDLGFRSFQLPHVECRGGQSECGESYEEVIAVIKGQIPVTWTNVAWLQDRGERRKMPSPDGKDCQEFVVHLIYHSWED